jgi:hypothetical protein
MEGSREFAAQLAEAVARRGGWIEDQEIPRLAEDLRFLHSQFEVIVGMLVRKGLLREDPYNYDQAVTELALPPDEVLPDLENTDELSYRLAAYRRQMEFLATGMRLNLATLDMQRLKTVSALVSWISWVDFGEGSRSPVTRAFARQFMKVRMGADTIAAGVLKDAHAQVEKVQARVRAHLAAVIAFHRESWKLAVRTAVLPRLARAPLAPAAAREDGVRALRRVFAQVSPGRPFYPELAGEILAEDSGEEAEARRAKLLASLVVTEEKPRPAAAAAAVPTRPYLLEAARILARAQGELSAALETLAVNQRLVESRRRGLAAWLRRIFLGAAGRRDSVPVYELEYADNPAAGTQSERIAFDPFLAEARKKTALLASLATPAGLSRLESAVEPALLEFVDKLLSDMFLLHRRMSGLNSLFQSRAAEGTKADIRGIRLELVAVKNSVVKANQKRHEYAARREEQEQVRSLASGSAAGGPGPVQGPAG